jgi:enoyl-CoA hydratase/carnithine racemase
MKLVERELRGEVALLKLNRSVTNPVNLALINELSGNVEKARDEKEIAGVVLSSANDKFFSIGFDIPQLIELNEKDFTKFYTAFNQLCVSLYTFPKPLIAAITGHAVAGGCILTLCCDYRFIAEGKKLMGLNEIKLGVPLPYPADRILRQIVDDRVARKILDTGDFFLPEETLGMGIVDEVMPLEQIVEKAVEKVESIQSRSLYAYAAIKRNRIEKVVAEIQYNLAAKEEIFIEMWYKQETRKKLKAALEKFSK